MKPETQVEWESPAKLQAQVGELCKLVPPLKGSNTLDRRERQQLTRSPAQTYNRIHRRIRRDGFYGHRVRGPCQEPP